MSIETEPYVADLPDLPREAPKGCPYAPPPEFTRWQREAPLTRVALPDGTSVWLATSYDLVRRILSHPDFSANPKTEGFPTWNLPGGIDLPVSMTHADPPLHTELRSMVAGKFSLKAMRALRPQLEQITLDRCAIVEALPQPFDFAAEFAAPIPALAISLLLGVPAADMDFFQRNTTALLAHDDLKSDEREQAKHALLQYMVKLIDEKVEDPSDDLLSELIHENPDLDTIGLISFAALLLIAGFSTTAHMIELSTLTLIQHPDLAGRIREDRTVVPALVDELLRYHAIVRDSPRRVALCDVTFDDIVIRAGEGVITSVQAANWDRAAFPEPDRIDLDRPRSPKSVAFGHGIHTCLGNNLAKIELEVILEELANRYPRMSLAIPADEIPFRTTTHLHGCVRLPIRLL